MDSEKDREARMEEAGFMKEKELWDKVPKRIALGQRTASVKWVDTKGNEERPNI